MFFQTIVSGLALGSLYALAAIGLVLIFKTSNIVNFAQGEMAMISTFVAFQFLSKWGTPYWAAALIALIFAFGLGWLVYALVLARLKQADPLSQIIVTLGLFLVFHGVAGAIWGNIPSAFPAAVSSTTFQLGSASVTHYQVFVMAVTLVLMLMFYLLFKFTRTGLAMQAVAQNMSAARLMGVSINQVFGYTWAISTLLGAVAGLLIAPILFLTPSFMETVAVKAFAAAVMGGFTSLPGAVVGGLLLGIIESLFGFYVSTALKTSFVFALIVLILYVRPTGLFGGKEVKKV